MSITELQTYQTQLEQNRVANEKALAQINYSITTARRALDRRKVLLAENSVAQETVDQLQVRLNYDVKPRPMQEASNRTQEQLRLQQLPQIRRQLSTLEQDVKITHGTLDDLVVRAPVSGRLTALDPKVGQSLDADGRVAVITPGTGYKLSAAIGSHPPRIAARAISTPAGFTVTGNDNFGRRSPSEVTRQIILHFCEGNFFGSGRSGFPNCASYASFSDFGTTASLSTH